MAVLRLLALNEVRLGDEIFESAEDKAEVQAAKRRTRFQFSMVGIPIGSTLRFYRDPTITCVTNDDKNKVNFRGEIRSLSDAALQVTSDMGFEWPSVSGPWEWSYNGRRLDKIRREIEEDAD